METPETYYYEGRDIRDLLIEEFPEFIQNRKFDTAPGNRESAYGIAGHWGIFIRESFQNGNDKILIRALKFVNKIMNDEKADPALINMLHIELFENIIGFKRAVHGAIDNHHGKAISNFGLTMQHFRILD